VHFALFRVTVRRFSTLFALLFGCVCLSRADNGGGSMQSRTYVWLFICYLLAVFTHAPSRRRVEDPSFFVFTRRHLRSEGGGASEGGDCSSTTAEPTTAKVLSSVYIWLARRDCMAPPDVSCSLCCPVPSLPAAANLMYDLAQLLSKDSNNLLW